MGRSLGFGSAQCNSIARLGLAFAAASRLFLLTSLHWSNSPAHYAKGTQSEERTRRLALLLPLVGTRFQVLFHSASAVLFTFPSRYWFAIGHQRVFSLRRWSSWIHAGFLVSGVTRVSARKGCALSLTGLSPSLGRLSSAIQLAPTFVTSAGSRMNRMQIPQPRTGNECALTRVRFRLFPFRSPLLRESLLLSLPGGTEMFQFSPLALPRLCIQRGVDAHYGVRVAPFGNPRIKGCLHLPEAYRSLPRPSSPAGAKASTVRPL
jgi:hypothetical protein